EPIEVEPGADTLVSAGDHPTAVAHDGVAWWQPPELVDPSNPLLPRSQYGSVASAAAVARWLNHHDHDPAVAVEPVPYHLPVTVQWWEEGDDRWVLAGNLEAGWIGDARLPRAVRLVAGPEPTELDVPPEGCVVALLDRHVGANT